MLIRRARPTTGTGAPPVRVPLAGIAAVFVAMELGLVALLGAGMYVLAGTRAYASGETVWSNAQNDAVLHLADYAVAHRASDYEAYLADRDVGVADRDARTELESATPDMDRVREALIRGGNHPEDIDAMVWLFRTFRNAQPVQDAVSAWIDADASIDHLQWIGAQLHSELSSDAPDQARLDYLRDQLDAVDAQASEDGNRFAGAIAQTARLVQTALIWGAVGGSGLLLGLGSMATMGLLFRVRKQESRFHDELRTTEDRLRAALQAGQLGSWEWDLASGQHVWSEGMSSIFGPRADAFSGTFSAYVARWVHPEDRRLVRKAVLASIRESRDCVTEHRVCADDGQIRWISCRGRVLRDATGRPSRMLGTLSDVTARVQSEAALRASEERLRLALESADMGIWDQDFTTGSGVWSDIARRQLGLPPDAPSDFEHVLAAVHPDDRHRVRQEMAQSLKSGDSYRVDSRVVWADGSVHHLTNQARVHFGPDGRPQRMLGVVRDVTEHKSTEYALRSLEQQNRLLIDNASDVVVAYDASGRFTFVNRRWETLTGYSVEEATRMTLADVLHPDDRPRVLDNVRRRLGGEQFATNYDLRIVSKTGEVRWVDANISLIRSGNEILGLQAFVRDITDRVRAEEALRESEARKGAMLAGALDGVISIDESGKLTEFNPAAERMFGYARDQVLGRDVADVIVPERLRDLHGRGLARGGVGIDGNMLDRRVETIGLRADGSEFPVELALTRVTLGDRRAYTGFLRDISDRKKAERNLAHQAQHDALTGLPNRSLLKCRLDQQLERMRSDGEPLALLLLDLDRFKDVNDTLGHGTGDLVLQQVAERLRATLRPEDTVARLGGDEFALLISGADRPTALTTGETVRAALAQPIGLDGLTFDLGASVGVALGPEHGEDAATLLRRADLAMYAAKRSGIGLGLYHPDLDQDTAERLALTVELRQAIEDNQLVLHYQPKVEVASGRAVGVEALVRWEHPQRGLLGPDEFIPLAEQAGLIGPLTQRVLRAARSQHDAWRAAGLDLKVAANLSMRSLHDSQLLDTVREIAAEGDGREWLELELTESTLMADPERARALLSSLRELGVCISIDDFGTGYSSLAYLKRLAVDELKIDRCFVREMALDERDCALVKATVDLAHTLGLRVVAEGVEDAAALELLQEMGCDLVQGFLISNPLPGAELPNWLTRWNPPVKLVRDRPRRAGRTRANRRAA